MKYDSHILRLNIFHLVCRRAVLYTDDPPKLSSQPDTYLHPRRSAHMLRCSPYKLSVQLYQKSPGKDFSHILGDPRSLRLFCFRILALFLIQRINHYTVCICEFTIEFFIDALNDLVQWTGTIFLTTSSFWLSRFPRSRLAFKFDCTFVCLFQTIIFQLDSIIKVKWLYGIGGKQLCQVRAENVLLVQFLIEHTGNLRNVIICLPFFIHYHRLLTLRTSMCVKLL